jgi:hypothetical protein
MCSMWRWKWWVMELEPMRQIIAFKLVSFREQSLREIR